MKQPPVMGEVVGGILLGPSFLGLFFPEVSAFVITPESLRSLYIVAQIGILLYMFLVGLEMNLDELKSNIKSTVFISLASVVFAFIVGIGTAYFLYEQYSLSSISLFNFSLFIGVSFSITAFPVLARILSDRKMIQTHLGSLALACAAIDDVIAWCLLACSRGRDREGNRWELVEHFCFNFWLYSADAFFYKTIYGQMD